MSTSTKNDSVASNHNKETLRKESIAHAQIGWIEMLAKLAQKRRIQKGNQQPSCFRETKTNELPQ